MSRQRKRALVFNDTRAERHFGCDLVMSELVRNLQARNIEVIATYPAGTDWRESSHLPKCGDADLLVVNGEGSIHHPESRPRAVYLSELGRYAKEKLGVPAYLINASVSDINESVATSLKDFDGIYVREPDSAATLSGFGLSSTIVPDLTVTAAFPERCHRASSATICATDSVIPGHSEAIRSLAMQNSWPYRGMHWKRRWWEKLLGVSNDRRTAGVTDFASFLGAHQLVVTGRFHTVTMCIGMKIPFVAVESNTHKISSFVTYALGNARRIVPANHLVDMDPAAFMSYTQEELLLLSSRLSEFRNARDMMFDKIADAA